MNAGRHFLDQLTSWSPVLLLGGLAALTFWLDAQVQSQGPRRDGTMRHDPDLFVEQVRAVTYDADGRVQQSLAAQEFAGVRHQIVQQGDRSRGQRQFAPTHKNSPGGAV